MENSAEDDLAASPSSSPSSQLSIPVPWRLPLSETALPGTLESIFHKIYPFHLYFEGGGKTTYFYTTKNAFTSYFYYLKQWFDPKFI